MGTEMNKLLAFLRGIIEFRSDFTQHYDALDYELLKAYDRGRELAHRATFRKWDN